MNKESKSYNNLFNLVQTSQRENLSSSALAYFLKNRDEFSNQLFEKLTGNKLSSSDQLEVILEYSFKNEGRVDLLLTTNDSCYAIENKLNADFGEDQLSRYSIGISNINRENKKLIALVPKRLKEYEKGSVADFVYWEELLKTTFNQTPHLWDELKEFVSETISPNLPEIDFTEQKERIEDQHKSFLRIFSEKYIPSERLNLGSGREYTGFYFKGKNQVTLGYFSFQVIKEKVCLIILTREDFMLSELFKEIDNDRPKTWRRAEANNLQKNYKIWTPAQPSSGVIDWNQIGEDLFKSIKKNAK